MLPRTRALRSLSGSPRLWLDANPPLRMSLTPCHSHSLPSPRASWVWMLPGKHPDCKLLRHRLHSCALPMKCPGCRRGSGKTVGHLETEAEPSPSPFFTIHCHHQHGPGSAVTQTDAGTGHTYPRSAGAHTCVQDTRNNQCGETWV